MTAVAPAATRLDLSVLLGDWRNTNAEGRVSRLVCTANESGAIDVRAFGRFPGGDADWGSVAAPVYSFTFEEQAAGAFCAKFDFGTEHVTLQANVKLGVLVVVELVEFRDESGRSNFFDREFFHRVAR